MIARVNQSGYLKQISAIFYYKISKRARGIEPPSQAWEARILPLNHARKSFNPADNQDAIISFGIFFIYFPQHFLYFFPDPQGQGSFRPTFSPSAVRKRLAATVGLPAVASAKAG